MKKLNIPKKQAGYSIVELMIGFGIAAGIVGTVYAGATKVQSDQRVSKLSEGVGQIVTGIQTTFGDLGSYSTVTTTTVVDGKLVPKTFRVDPGAPPVINHNADGTVTAATADSGAAYTVTVTAVPKEACTRLISRLDGMAAAIGVLDSMATPPDLTSAAAAGTVKVDRGALDAAKVATQCAADTNGDGRVEVIAKAR